MLGIRPTDPVGTLVTGPVATTSPTATLRGAAEALASDGLGLLVVVGAAGPRAVLSERDIVTAIASGDDVDVERVRDHASVDLLIVEEEASVRDAMQVLLEAEVRHLVVARQGVIVGVISIRDLAAVLLEQPAAA